MAKNIIKFKRLEPYLDGAMLEDDAGEYVRYEDMRQVVRLAIKWELCRIVETRLADKLEQQINAEVRKFWEALGYHAD